MNNRLARVVRGRRLDRNPLRRRTDRAQTLIWAGLFVMFAVLAPFAYSASMNRAADVVAQNRAATLAVGHEVTAVTTVAASQASDSIYIGVQQAQVTAAWMAPDGRHRTGIVLVPKGTPAHTALAVWVRHDGTLIAPPISVADAHSIAIGVGAGVLATMFVTVMLIGTVAVMLLNKRRMAAWDSEWTVTEPAWSHRG